MVFSVFKFVVMYIRFVLMNPVETNINRIGWHGEGA